MKILRVLRRRKIRLSFVLILLVVFAFNTYAWITTDTVTESGAFTVNVSTWGVEFRIEEDEPITTETYTFEVDEFYPGITKAGATGTDGISAIEKKVYIYNIGDPPSNIEYEITNITLYGTPLFEAEEDNTKGEAVTNADASVTVNAFGNADATIFDSPNKYEFDFDPTNADNTPYTLSLRYPTPFEITYNYDKTYVEGNDGSDASKAEMTIKLAWHNDEANNVEDTKLGNMAYEFRNSPLGQTGEPALKIEVKITATRADV